MAGEMVGAAGPYAQIDFTNGGLSSHVTAPGSNTVVEQNLLECSIAGNESYYGLTETVSYDKEVFIEQEMKFGTNFDFGQGQKILRVRAYNSVGQVNYWDFIVQITSQGSSSQQAGTTESYQITAARNSGSTWGAYTVTLTRQQWYRFKYRYKLNSAQGVADGIFQMWLDDVLIFNLTALDLTGGGTWNNTINRILWGGWYSNGAGGNPTPDPDPSPATYQIRNARRWTESVIGALVASGSLAGTSAGIASSVSTILASGALSGATSGAASIVAILSASGSLIGTSAGIAVGVGVQGLKVASITLSSKVYGEVLDSSR